MIYHFDLGDSNGGPVGLCVSVSADSPEQALERAVAFMDANQTIEIAPSDEHGQVVYANVYLNSEAVSVDDIDGEEE